MKKLSTITENKRLRRLKFINGVWETYDKMLRHEVYLSPSIQKNH